MPTNLPRRYRLTSRQQLRLKALGRQLEDVLPVGLLGIVAYTAMVINHAVPPGPSNLPLLAYVGQVVTCGMGAVAGVGVIYQSVSTTRLGAIGCVIGLELFLTFC